MKIKWKDFELHTLKLLNKIKKNGFKPDVIVAVGNSGLIPAVMVAKALKTKDFEWIRIYSYNEKNEKIKSRVISSNLSKSLERKKVLCVDDIVATGETFALAKKEILRFNPKEIRFAACIVSQYVCKKYPDYWGETILRNAEDFISLPWDNFL
ncbi:MAG: phosphoribosyltransferase family protein [Candidatus Beckwithbacteria bacterium]|nr:phosphoribosyltransferase family protein [Candidatus Beckwithbacteria bacterium]